MVLYCMLNVEIQLIIESFRGNFKFSSTFNEQQSSFDKKRCFGSFLLITFDP